MHLGYSLKRLNRTNMPSFVNTKRFGYQLALKTGLNMVDESIDSRVVLLSKLKKLKM
jgi:tRNA wybutosine-synthesizing protein 1